MPAPAGGGSKPPPALMAAASNNDFTKENVMSTMAVLKQRETVRELSAYLKQEVPPLYNALIAERGVHGQLDTAISRKEGRRGRWIGACRRHRGECATRREPRRQAEGV